MAGRPIGSKARPRLSTSPVAVLRRPKLRPAKTETVAAIADQFPAATRKDASYDPVLAAQILEHVADGYTLKEACTKLPVYVSPQQFKRWVLAHNSLRKIWETAKNMRASALFDHANELARRLETTVYGPGDASKVNALRTAIETYKWSAGKLSPQEFGDKTPNMPTIAIQINTGLDLGAGAGPGELPEVFDYKIIANVPANPLTPPEEPNASEAE